VTDVYNRKWILLVSVTVNAVAAIGLAWNSAYGDAYVRNAFLFLLLSGCARGFQQPARRSFLPRIVPREVFPNAVSWHSSGFELSSMGGPALGGALIAVLGGAMPVYLINAAGLLMFLALVSGIPYVHEKVIDRRLKLDSILAGFRFIRRTPVVFAAITLDMLGVLLGGAVALMPVFARDILEVGPTGLGWLMASPAVGAFTMALVQAHTRPARQAGGRLLVAVTGFGLATIVFGLSTSFLLSIAALVVLGACDNISVVIRGVLVQMLTPDAMRGRVSAIDGVFIGTSNELGAFESGAVAELFGPVISVVTSTSGIEAIDPRRSRSQVTSSRSVSKRTGTSNSKPAVTRMPEPGAAAKVTTPLVAFTDQPDSASTPPRATLAVPVTGFTIRRTQACAPLS
jgi:MFS family permease